MTDGSDAHVTTATMAVMSLSPLEVESPDGGNEDGSDAYDQVILMTHTGPTELSTSEDRRDAAFSRDPILAGSSSVRSFLCARAAQASVLVNVHGHTHEGVGCAKLGKVRVVNPGSLKVGDYGFMTVAKGLDNRWEVKSVAFHCV